MIRRISVARIAILTLAVSLYWIEGDSVKAAAAAGDRRYQQTYRIQLKGPTYAVAWSPNGTRLAVLEPPFIDLIDTDSWKIFQHKKLFYRQYTGRSICFIDNNRLIVGRPDASVGGSGAISVLDIPQLELASESLQMSWTGQTSDELSQDRFVISKSLSKVAALTLSGKEIITYDLTTKATLVVKSPKVQDAIWVYRTNPDPRPLDDIFTSISISPDESTICACSELGNVYFIRNGSIESNLTVHGARTHAPCEAISYSLNGEYVVLLSKQFALLTDNYSNLSNLQTPMFNHFTEVMDIYSTASRKLSYNADLGPYLTGALTSAPVANNLVKADSKDLALLTVSEEGKIVETQHLGNGAFTLALSSDGRIASVEGSDVVIYSIISGEK